MNDVEPVLIRDARYVITMDDKRRILERSSIYIEDGKILAIGDWTEVSKVATKSGIVIECRWGVAIPGLINAHTHIAMVAMRGLAIDRTDVIYKIFWPIEKALTPQLIYDLALLGALEALHSGCTVINDHYFFMDSIAEAVVKVGIRGLLGHTVMSWDGPWVGEEELKKALHFIDRWRGRSDLIIPVLAPHAPDTVAKDVLQFMGEVAREKDLLIHLHLAQTHREYVKVKEMYGTTPVRLLKELDFLSDRVIAAHCIFIDDEEKDILAKSGCIVVQCPSTYAFSGNHYYAVDIMKRGGKVVLGTDAPCFNDNTDMFEEMRLLIATQRLVERDPLCIKGREILEICTRKAARYLRLANIGSIEVGKEADLVILDLRRPHMIPTHDIVSNVVYSATTGDVHTVIVSGRVVLHEYRATQIHEDEVIKRGEEASRRLIKRALDMTPELCELLARD